MRLPPFPLVQWFAAAEGRFDRSLSHSDCEPLSVADLFHERELAEVANLRLGYGEFAGLAQLRNVVARQYATLDKDLVQIYSGASEAIYTFMRAMLEPGDEVVAQSPLFNSLHEVARSVGCTVTDWRPTDEMTCSFDASDLARICNERTKLIVFNFPHNPSGQMISEGELRQILDTARRVNAFVFSDEQFRLLELPPAQTLRASRRLTA